MPVYDDFNEMRNNDVRYELINYVNKNNVNLKYISEKTGISKYKLAKFKDYRNNYTLPEETLLSLGTFMMIHIGDE